MSKSNRVVQLAAASFLTTLAATGAAKAQAAGDVYDQSCGCWHHGGHNNTNNNTNNVGNTDKVNSTNNNTNNVGNTDKVNSTNTNKVNTNSQSYSGSQSIAKQSATTGASTASSGGSSINASGSYGLSISPIQLGNTEGGTPILPDITGTCNDVEANAAGAHTFSAFVFAWGNRRDPKASTVHPNMACMHEVTKGQVAVAVVTSDTTSCVGKAYAEVQTLGDSAEDRATAFAQLTATCNVPVAVTYAPAPVYHHAAVRPVAKVAKKPTCNCTK